MIISQFPSGAVVAVPQFTYTGDYFIESDSQGWKIKFLSSGTLKVLQDVTVDIFAVGGGGAGSNSYIVDSYSIWQTIDYGGGGGGGYTTTEKEVTLTANTEYAVTVGLGGSYSGTDGGASSFADLCVANGGGGGYGYGGTGAAGSGGSGGAASGSYMWYTTTGAYYSGKKINYGGTDGGDGEIVNSEWLPGTGQGTTTREFGDPNGALYASGGGAQAFVDLPNVSPNTGNGGHGGGSRQANIGASGIVIIRNVRAA